MTEIPRRTFAKLFANLIVSCLPPTITIKTYWWWSTISPDGPLQSPCLIRRLQLQLMPFFEKLILEHGAPEVLLSDNDKEFTNDTLAYVYQKFNIEQHFTSPYTPRSNGKMENFNKFLKASISKLCQGDTAAWGQVLDQILFAYRCCPHISTGEAPYFITGIHHYSTEINQMYWAI